MDDILVVDEDLVDINCDGNKQSDNKKGNIQRAVVWLKAKRKARKSLQSSFHPLPQLQ